MKSTASYLVTGFVLLGLLVPVSPADAASDKAQQQFERAYFLETHEGDLQQAADLYEVVAQDRHGSQELAAEAQQRRQCCLEDLRSQDLASLMPADAIGYVEVRQPGQHIENLAEMLGLTGDPLSNLTGDRPSIPIPDAPGMVVPAEVFLSPGIINELKRFHGVAVAVTGVEPPPVGNPDLGGVQGVVLLHPGHDEALRGLIETFAQFVLPADPIGGFPTIAVEPGIVVAFTNRLVVAGTSRELVSDVIERLNGRGGESLASRPDVIAMGEQRRDALLFAFVDVKSAVATAYRHLSNDPEAMQALGMAQGLCDIGHMQSVSLSVGSSPEGVYAETVMALDEGHANLVYNLVRTPPMTGRSLKNVPCRLERRRWWVSASIQRPPISRPPPARCQRLTLCGTSPVWTWGGSCSLTLRRLQST